MFPSVNARLSLIIASLSVALLIVSPRPAAAQDDEKEEPKKIDPEKLKQAQQLIKEGKAHEEASEYGAAVEKYEAAFAAVPDPQIKFLIGDTHRKNGADEKAVKAWKEYIELDPEGKVVEQAKERVEVVEKEIEQANKTAKEEKERQRIAAEKLRKELEDAKRREAAKLPMAVNAMVAGGVDQRTTVIVRAMAGGLIRFGKFAPEAHVAFEGFIRPSEAKGTKGQSFTLLDLGARYAFVDENFSGPFVAGGASFGIFAGSPKNVALENDEKSCSQFEGNDCAFEVNQLITTRLGFGYGFRSSEKTTVALRLDLTAFFYSVADNQPQEVGFPPAGSIDKPQMALAAMLGIEFLRWR